MRFSKLKEFCRAMGKKLTSILVLLLAALMALTACGNYNWSVSGDYSGEVKSNGGFVVEKGNYVYFINGTATAAADNTFGSVQKGSLVRVNKDMTGDPVIVVPRLMVAGDFTSGIYIYGDYVYYATPATSKGKDGKVQSSYLDLTRTKLDGSGTPSEPFARLTTNTWTYRFMEKDGVVYAVYYDATAKSIISVNTETKKSKTIAETITAATFTKEASSNVIFYTMAVTSVSGTTESFNDVYMVYCDGADIDDDNYEGIKVFSGAKGKPYPFGEIYTLITIQNDVLYFSYTDVDKEITKYCALKLADIGEDTYANLTDKTIVLSSASNGNTYVSTSSLFVDVETIIYSDTQYGLCVYKHNASGERRRILTNVTGLTPLFVDGDYLYCRDTSSLMYRIDYKSSQPELVKLSSATFSTSWYPTEIVDGRYLLFSYTADTYSYVHYIDLTAEGNTDDDFEPTRIAVISDADQEAMDEAEEE